MDVMEDGHSKPTQGKNEKITGGLRSPVKRLESAVLSGQSPHVNLSPINMPRAIRYDDILAEQRRQDGEEPHSPLCITNSGDPHRKTEKVEGSLLRTIVIMGGKVILQL
jgi:hypothetical protein